MPTAGPGFAPKAKSRDLKRIWKRRAKIRQKVELLELGKVGGVYKKAKRTSGKMRRACIGQGMRSAVALEPAPKKRRVEAEEGGEEGGEGPGATTCSSIIIVPY